MDVKLRQGKALWKGTDGFHHPVLVDVDAEVIPFFTLTPLLIS